MTLIIGPMPTGEIEKRKIEELKTKYGLSDLKARRRVVANALRNQERKQK